jgi:hypothetical protein
MNSMQIPQTVWFVSLFIDPLWRGIECGEPANHFVVAGTKKLPRRLYVVGLGETLGGQVGCDEIIDTMAQVVQLRSVNGPTKARLVLDRSWASLPKEEKTMFCSRSAQDVSMHNG